MDILVPKLVVYTFLFYKCLDCNINCENCNFCTTDTIIMIFAAIIKRETVNEQEVLGRMNFLLPFHCKLNILCDKWTALYCVCLSQ
jgi:hypothetical protein